MHILFLCTGNSCRSILAEAIFNEHAPQGFTAESAGSKPAGYIHPLALAELSQHNINVQGFASKSWNNLISKPDLVITLCSEAAGEACPLYLGDVLRAHWGMPDPAASQGSEAEIQQVFSQTYKTLEARIKDFFALPFAELLKDKEKMMHELEAIAKKIY